MRKVLLTVACWATIGLAGTQAAVTYQYVTDAPTYNIGGVGAVGSTVNVRLFLQETVTGTDKSIINTDGGLFGAGVMVNRTGSGDATFRLVGSPVFVISANQNVGGPWNGPVFNPGTGTTANIPGGFGGYTDNGDTTFSPVPPTLSDRTPSTTTSAGLVVNSDTPATSAQLGTHQIGVTVPETTPGVYKVLLGSLNVVVGNNTTTFTVSNYGSHGNTVTQAKTDLDFSGNATLAPNTPYVGASTPVGGFYTFSVAGAAVPEPTSMALCGLLASGMGYFGYRRRKTSATEAALVA